MNAHCMKFSTIFLSLLTPQLQSGQVVQPSVYFYSDQIHLHVPVYRWSGAFLSWESKCRIRHVTSGRYLGVTDGDTLTTVHRTRADDETTVFVIKQSKVS